MSKELDEMREKMANILRRNIQVKDTVYGEKEYHFFPEAIDEILSLETDTCRIAVVRKEGILPSVAYIHDGNRMEETELSHYVQMDMLSARYVQEVSSD